MRTVRKGTRSCWACRRRKVRCTFADPSDAACTGCRRRSVRCIGQEFPDEPSPSDRGTMPVEDGDRLGRIEAMIERLARRLDESHDTTAASLSLSQLMPANEYRLHSPGGELLPQNALPVPASPSKSRLPVGDVDILQALRDAWPSQQDLDIILTIPVPVSSLFHGVVFTSYSTFMHKSLPRVADLLQLHAGDARPATAARRLLLLSTYLQNVNPRNHPSLAQLGIGHEHAMHRAFEAATRLVTSSDRLAESVEGVECIMIESMYHNNAGNLRRAWLVLRRAIGIAQLMGLDRPSSARDGSVSWPLARMVEPETTAARIDPGRMWFRLIASDRYLSLMLGLAPAAADDAHLLAPRLLDKCTAMERMERVLVVAGGRILRRNDGGSSSRAPSYGDENGGIMETDRLLRQAAGLMPPKWWLIPSPEDASSGFDESDVDYDEAGREMRETMRLMNQMVYYHLLIRLHLPYLLRVLPSRSQYEYSRTTAIDASRELLARYVSFRLSPASRQHSSSSSSSQPELDPATPPYCRGVDFLAFVASTVLCLASIDSRRYHHPQTHQDQDDLPTSPPSNSHRRPADRGLMEHTLDIMQSMADHNGDAIATRVASVLRPLLAIEANDVAAAAAAAATAATAASSSSSKRMAYYSLDTESDLLECGGCVGRQGDVHVRIPYLGTIDIGFDDTEAGRGGRFHRAEDDGAPRYPDTEDNNGRDDQQMGCASSCEGAELSFSYGGQQGLPSPLIDVNGWVLQGVDLALFEGLVDGME